MDSSYRSFSNLKTEKDDFQHMSLILEAVPQHHFGELWIGDYVAATELKQLRINNIKTVITCAVDLDVKYGHNVTHHVLEMLDSDKFDIYPFFQKARALIMDGLKMGSVLVHCAAGISRSASLVISFLMDIKKWGFHQTLNYVKSKRYVVCPNRGFVQQLKLYEKLLSRNNTDNDKILERITNTTRDIANSLQKEITDQIDEQQGKSVRQAPKYIINGGQQSATKRKNSRAMSAKGFRLIDLVDLDKNFKENLNEKTNNNMNIYRQNLSNVTSNTLDISNINQSKIKRDSSFIDNIDLNKLTEAPSPPIMHTKGKAKLENNMRRTSKRSNSQQRLNQITDKLLKEENDLQYDKFEYKPRFKRMPSAKENNNNNGTGGNIPPLKNQQKLNQYKQKPINSVQNSSRQTPRNNQQQINLSGGSNNVRGGLKTNNNIVNQKKNYLPLNAGRNQKKTLSQVRFEVDDPEFDRFEDNDPNMIEHRQMMQEFQDLEEQYLGEHIIMDQDISDIKRRGSNSISGQLPPRPNLGGKKGFKY